MSKKVTVRLVYSSNCFRTPVVGKLPTKKEEDDLHKRDAEVANTLRRMLFDFQRRILAEENKK